MLLQLTEEVTLISADGIRDETYNNLVQTFGEDVPAQLIMQVIIINSWNRIAVSTKQVFE